MFEPVVLFFLLGVIAGLSRSDLKLPAAVYEALSVYLLLAIGLKGGVELAKHDLASLVLPSVGVMALGIVIALVAFVTLSRLGRLPRADAASIAAHYGSVSVVTFAVGASWLSRQGVAYEAYLTVFLALMEAPAIVAGVLLAKGGGSAPWGRLLREVVAGRSVLLLAGGLVIGWSAGPEGIQPLDRFFFDLFKGVLALFLLELGVVVAARLPEVRRFGPFLLGFALGMPLLGALLGAALGVALGLSTGGTTLLAVLAASASYIAAPAAMRLAVPAANPALSIGAALGVTFPFNIFAGIPIYHWLAQQMHRLGG
jgi:hypothetical protein